MKFKEKEALKVHTVQELSAELHKARQQYGKLRFRHRSAPVKNPLELRMLRRQIARLETWIGEKSRTAAAPAK
jgi:large subunit ribosomal protein L29